MAKEFLDLVESINAEAASAQKLFGGEGKRIQPRDTPEYKQGLAEAARLVKNLVTHGSKYDQYMFQEAISTSDFPIYFGDILDRQIMQSYAEAPASYTQWCKVSEVADFRPTKRYAMDGGEGALKPVDELGEYQSVSRSESELSYSVKKFGARFDLSWEAVIDDTLGLLQDQPTRFGKAARRTEEREATKLLVNSNGFFDAKKNDNVLTGKPLSVQGLQDAIQKFSTKVDADGEPIMVGPAILLVPPALTVQANNIMNASEFWTQDGDDATFKIRSNNWLSGQLKVVTDYYLPVVDPKNGNSTYYLLADPSAARGAVEFAFLRGHRSPELFMKSPNTVAVGGAASGALTGDFDHDAIGYKVRHVMGGAAIDPKCALKVTA